MLELNLALAGLAIGSIAALSGVGLIVTYRATGVFNLAHGAMATLAAYLVYQAVEVWGWPIGLAVPLVVLVVLPALGVLVDLAVFRPLQRRGGAPTETLVAGLGLLLLLVGVVYLVWGLQSLRAPALLPPSTVSVGQLIVHVDALEDLAIVAAVTGLLALVTGRTRLGVQVRAVVDRRHLAELCGVRSGRVSALGWAVGAGLAGLTGVLLAPVLLLNPYNLTIVVLEIFAVPVLARLSSVPVAVAGGLAIGVAASELSRATALTTNSLVAALQANLFVVVLLAALLLLRRLREVGDVTAAVPLMRPARFGAAGRAVLAVAAAGFLAAPLAFPDASLRHAQQVPALAVVFLSLVLVTGHSGQISLGQAGYAGLGALFFARFSAGAPQLVALLAGVLAAGAVGFATGYPAIRRRGLFLALTTFAVAAVVSRFVFEQPYFTSGVQVHRPGLFGLSLSGDRAFYVFELGCLTVALLLARNLRSGRLGRSLAAMRDDEEGARAVGISIPTLKVFVFTVSAVLAGLGGALLAQTQQAFDPTAFQPLEGLFWFTTVVAFGADSALAAVLAAAFAVLVGSLAHDVDAYTVPVGLLALAVSRVPGGAAAAVRRLAVTLTEPPPQPPAVLRTAGLRLSATGRAALARARR